MLLFSKFIYVLFYTRSEKHACIRDYYESTENISLPSIILIGELSHSNNYLITPYLHNIVSEPPTQTTTIPLNLLYFQLPFPISSKAGRGSSSSRKYRSFAITISSPEGDPRRMEHGR